MWIFYSTVNVFSLPYGFLNDICFSLAYFMIRIQYIIHTTYKIFVNGQLMLSVGYGKFWGSQKLYLDFPLCGGSVPLVPVLFKDQLYFSFISAIRWNSLPLI